MFDEKMEVLQKLDSFAIYGAGVMAKALHKILSEAPYFKKTSCFIVKSKEGNPEFIDGIRVLSLDEGGPYKNQPVLVALHEKYMKVAVADLKNAGYNHLIPVTFDSDLWCDIREEWMNENRLMPYGVLPSGEALLPYEACNSEMHIYVVHSEFDKALDEDNSDTEYEISIQVGADSAGEIKYDVCDNTGENISGKNKKYCELTGLYWVWKHDSADYIGLSHYRRKFILSDLEIGQILSGKIDMIVTVPIVNLDTVKGQYCKDHCEDDWKVLTRAVETLSPDYVKALETVANGNYYFAYNMFIAKRGVLNDYCSWLFPILKYCEEQIGDKEDAYQNRYVGFLAERLLTVYIANHPELKVVVAKKHFFESKS